jgi:hypothetical protein
MGVVNNAYFFIHFFIRHPFLLDAVQRSVISFAGSLDMMQSPMYYIGTGQKCSEDGTAYHERNEIHGLIEYAYRMRDKFTV